jgi:branched-chain amino acid transport system ATP-binding protein
MLLDFRGLRKAFGSASAADRIDLSVAAGEAVGIIAPNGAGKSTLFNLIIVDLHPNASEIPLDGVGVTLTAPHQRSRAGIVGSCQIPHPFENIIVFENFLVGAVYSRRKHEVVNLSVEILDRTHLFHRADVPGFISHSPRSRLPAQIAVLCEPLGRPGLFRQTLRFRRIPNRAPSDRASQPQSSLE